VETGSLVAVGEVCRDLYSTPRGDGDVEEPHLGGISANFARVARRAGAEVALFAAIGDDPEGRWVAARLHEEGLDAHVRVLSGHTACQRLRVAPGGERVFTGFEPGVMTTYALDAHELGLLARARAIALPCSPESQTVVAQVLAEVPPEVAIVGDFSQDSLAPGALAGWLEGHLARLSIAFVGGRVEDRGLLEQLARTHHAHLVLTAGPDGAYSITEDGVVHQPSVVETLVDTTGCGDAFAAGFTVAWLGGAARARALFEGARWAAHVAGRRGAGP
jgi:sugar/nucleoside kinase (ribokinase family)